FDHRRIDDEQFLSQCRTEAFRGSGPGGQKRNKTSSAVRLIHIPTGVGATAEEFRSQAQNRAAALRRLRHRLALQFRESTPKELSALDFGVSTKNAAYLPLMAIVLDVLEENGWAIAESANRLKLSTGQLVKFLNADEKLWMHVNQ